MLRSVTLKSIISSSLGESTYDGISAPLKGGCGQCRLSPVLVETSAVAIVVAYLVAVVLIVEVLEGLEEAKVTLDE